MDRRICFSEEELQVFIKCYPCALQIYVFMKAHAFNGEVRGYSHRDMMRFFDTNAGSVKKGVSDLEKKGLIIKLRRARNNSCQDYVLPFVKDFISQVKHVDRTSV